MISKHGLSYEKGKYCIKSISNPLFSNKRLEKSSEILEGEKAIDSYLPSKNIFSSNNFFTAIDSDNIQLKIIEIPLTPDKDIYKALKYAIENLFSLNEQEIYFSYVKLNESDDKMKLLVGVVEKKSLNKAISRLTAKNIYPNSVEIKELAVLNYILSMDRADFANCLLLYKNEIDLSILAIKDGALIFVRKITYSKNNLVSNIEETINYIRNKNPDFSIKTIITNMEISGNFKSKVLIETLVLLLKEISGKKDNPVLSGVLLENKKYFLNLLPEKMAIEFKDKREKKINLFLFISGFMAVLLFFVFANLKISISKSISEKKSIEIKNKISKKIERYKYLNLKLSTIKNIRHQPINNKNTALNKILSELAYIVPEKITLFEVAVQPQKVDGIETEKYKGLKEGQTSGYSENVITIKGETYKYKAIGQLLKNFEKSKYTKNVTLKYANREKKKGIILFLLEGNYK